MHLQTVVKASSLAEEIFIPYVVPVTDDVAMTMTENGPLSAEKVLQLQTNLYVMPIIVKGLPQTGWAI